MQLNCAIYAKNVFTRSRARKMWMENMLVRMFNESYFKKSSLSLKGSVSV